jgi:hypothetical protein
LSYKKKEDPASFAQRPPTDDDDDMDADMDAVAGGDGFNI